MEQHALKNVNNSMNANHRHLRNIDCLTVRVFFISTVNGCSKKRKEAYYELRQQQAHKQNLSNLFWPFDIYDANIYSYLETSGGQSSYPYLNVVHF